MGLVSLIPIIAGILMIGILAKTVAPSTIQQIKTTKVDTQIIQTQRVIYEAVCRYITLKGTNPASLNDLITAGLFQSSSNNNGFGGTYSISIDSTKGTLIVTTDIADASARIAFINSYKNTFKPVQGSGNFVNTTFVLPMSVMHGNGQFMTGIPVQSAAPSASAHKFWYDTSGTEAVLKMSDGATWKSVASASSSSSSTGGASASSLGTIITSGSLATTTGTSGDLKYVYDSATNSIQQYAYYNGGWALAGGAGSTNKYIKIVNGARQWSDNSYATSCLKYIQSDVAGYNYNGDTGDGVYKIDPDGTGGNAPFDVYCDQTTDGGGWTLVLKINSSDSTTLRYDSSYWSNDILLNNTDTSVTLNQNMKNLGYSTMYVNSVKFCMSTLSNCKIETKSSTNLKTILNTTSTTKFTRNDFINWIPTSSSNWTNQPNCNHIGYNISGGSAGNFYGCRFGISMNNENDCLSNDASIGIGCGTKNFATTNYYSSSGGDRWNPDLNYQYQGWIFIK